LFLIHKNPSFTAVVECAILNTISPLYEASSLNKLRNQEEESAAISKENWFALSAICVYYYALAALEEASVYFLPRCKLY
jgi:hypothetical protein